MVALPPLTEADRVRIAEAVARAEAVTDAELRLVLAHRSSHYGAFALIYPALAALVAGGVAAAVIPGLSGETLFLGQAALFALGVAALQNMSLRAALAPAAARRKAAWRQARLYYASIGLKEPHLKRVLLVFCSEAERSVEILVDESIAEKLPEPVWKPVVASFTASLAKGAVADGFVAAADSIGAILAPVFPPVPGSANMLSDALVEL